MPHLPSRQTLTAALAGGAVAAGISVGPAVAEQTARMARHITGADIKNNSITGRDIRNSSLTGADIKNNTLTGRDILSKSIQGFDIADETIGGDKIKPDSIGSSDIVNNLDTVDIADNSLRGIDIREGDLGAREIDEASLDDVGSVRGRRSFKTGLDAGQDVLLAQHGPLSIRAQCEIDNGGTDRVRVYAATTEANSMLASDADSHRGGLTPADFLQPGTPPADSEMAEDDRATTTTHPEIDRQIDSGVVTDSDGGHFMALNTEGVVLGFDVGGKECYVAGVVDFG